MRVRRADDIRTFKRYRIQGNPYWKVWVIGRKYDNMDHIAEYVWSWYLKETSPPSRACAGLRRAMHIND